MSNILVRPDFQNEHRNEALEKYDAPRADLFEAGRDTLPFEMQAEPTCLHSFAAMSCRTNEWANWNGYTTPQTYVSLASEYDALHAQAALADMSWLTKYRLSGPQAEEFLQKLVTRNVTALPVHGAARVFFCDLGGKIVGEGVLFRLEEEDYRLTVEGNHLDWLDATAEGFNCAVEDISGTLGCIALSGPQAASIARQRFGDAVAGLPAGRALWAELHAAPVYISRTGSLGQEGFEIWVDAEDAPVIWGSLLRHHKEMLRPAGLAACELRRLERGIARFGRDYFGAECAVDPDAARTPYELGAGACVDLEKGPFNGRAALAKAKEKGAQWSLVALEVSGGEPARFAAVYCGDDRAGSATSIGWSPVLCANIALATIRTETLAADEGFNVHAEFPGEVTVRRARLPAKIARRPLF